MDRRTRARELAMQGLFQLDVQGDDALEIMDRFFLESGEGDFVRRLATGWTRGTWKNLAQCDEMIVASTIKWEVSRLSPVDRSILRLASYQLKFCSDIPPRVVINEAIELAKKFSTEKSPGFVNGVLDAVLKKLNTSDCDKEEE